MKHGNIFVAVICSSSTKGLFFGFFRRDPKNPYIRDHISQCTFVKQLSVSEKTKYTNRQKVFLYRSDVSKENEINLLFMLGDKCVNDHKDFHGVHAYT